MKKFAIAGFFVFTVLSAFLFLYKDRVTLTPWNTGGAINLGYHASGNSERTVIIENGEETVTVLNNDGKLAYQLSADPGRGNSFAVAERVQIDEQNNVYVLDKAFGGAFDNNVERVVKYSPAGKFLGEVYRYEYVNENFITTKGKISGMAYYRDALYLARLEKDGFYLERIGTAGDVDAEPIAFFNYPHALRDLQFFHINPQDELLAVTTKSGIIKQYNFSGALQGEWPPEDGFPTMVISDNRGNLIYTDILNSQIVAINGSGGLHTPLFTSPEGYAYFYIDYYDGTFYAATDDHILIRRENGPFERVDSYSYGQEAIILRWALFLAGILDVLILLGLLVSLVRFIVKRKFSETAKSIIVMGLCISAGAILASFLIVNEMTKRYNESIFANLENVSRLIAATIDTNILTSIDSPAQYDDAEYLKLKDSLELYFSESKFQGDMVYQLILMKKDNIKYVMYDLENSVGTHLPLGEVSIDEQSVYDTKQYMHGDVLTSSGGWLYVLGPIIDKNGEVAALIETGLELSSVQEQIRSMVIQTILIVLSVTVAIFLIVVEYILIAGAYRENKKQLALGKVPNFLPELLRPIIFFHFAATNLATAILPMYAANLYTPILNLPREFIVTLPFTAELVFAAIALLVVPVILQRFGLKRCGIIAAASIVLSFILCLIAANVLYLAVAYALVGFASGTILMILNTVVGTQRDIDDVNRGFAHFNASLLSGTNAGVIFGSILAQFLSYRLVYLFASIITAGTLVTMIISVRSAMISPMYEVPYLKDRRKAGVIKFIFTPAVFILLVLALLPFTISTAFTSYFMPMYGLENGLRESNIGQLMLLNGLFAILFGTSLCGYASKKFSIKTIVIGSLLLNAAALILFAFNISLVMLIAVIVLIAIVNIFASTNIQTHYAALFQKTRISSIKALSVYAAIENIGMAGGSVIFSYILAGEIGYNMKLFALSLMGCLVLFIILSAILGKFNRKPAGS
ncbi:MAG: MFS transporter [Treponema sp.]|nr:MFS transporter [Treponema sp.]